MARSGRYRPVSAPLLAVALSAVAVPAAATQTSVVGRDAALVEEVCAQLKSRGAHPAAAKHKSAWAKNAEDYQAAMAQVETARAAYNKGDIDGAWKGINSALNTIERAFAGVADYRSVARAYLFLADLANARGDRGRAEDSYLIAARFASDLELDPATTSPMIIEGYSTAKELLQNSPTGGLSIVSKPVGAGVIVDGEERGKTPLSLVLPAGPHLVSVHLPAHDVWATQVPVDPDNVRKLEVFLSPAAPLDVAAEDPTAEAMQELAALDATSDWLVVRREGEGISFAFLAAGAVVPVYGGPTTLPELPAAIDQAARALSEQPAADHEEEGIPAWAWITGGVIGGVVVIGAVATVLTVVLWPSDPETEYVSVFSK